MFIPLIWVGAMFSHGLQAGKQMYWGLVRLHVLVGYFVERISLLIPLISAGSHQCVSMLEREQL